MDCNLTDKQRLVDKMSCRSFNCRPCYEFKNSKNYPDKTIVLKASEVESILNENVTMKKALKDMSDLAVFKGELNDSLALKKIHHIYLDVLKDVSEIKRNGQS